MLRIKHTGGEKAEKGSYWNFTTGQRVTMSEAGRLPGDEETVYLKANPIIVLAAAPALGLLYALFLPFIGIAIIARVLVAKAMGSSAERISSVATFNWSPSAAYLAGRRNKKAKMESKKAEDEAKKTKE